MRSYTRLFIISLIFLTLAVLLRFWVAPALEQLPGYFRIETTYEQENQFRESPDSIWQSSQLKVRRIDQTLTALPEVVIIQGELQIFFKDDTVNFETGGLYGVQRSTRQNLPDYGNVRRNGHYFFPTHVSQSQYTLWDPFYIGPQSLTFDHIEMLEGVRVYVFKMTVSDLDETSGYSYLPIVPERYLAITTATGTLWVEPLSGIVVNYQDQGSSSWVDIKDHSTVAEFNTWTNIYTPETRAARLELARTTLLRMLVIEVFLPVLSLVAGLVFLLIGSFTRLRLSQR